MDSTELLQGSNSGILIKENIAGTVSVTSFYNQINLVAGSSKTGIFNNPLLVTSPDQFKAMFGDIDESLERKGSYFHRTVLNMLQHGPVVALNLRLLDDRDKYNWISLSTGSNNTNSTSKTNDINDFYDITSGFYARSVERVLTLANDKYHSTLPLHLVNTSAKPVSILITKSLKNGFNITVEDWYTDSAPPSYLHPKDLISDTLVDIIVVEGRWNNYAELSSHPKWSKYFNKYGIRKEEMSAFQQNPEVVTIKKWTASLIPYFKDRRGIDISIQSVINDDINQTGILCAYDVDKVETDYRSGMLDMLGETLNDTRSNINFLSYKRSVSRYYLLEETFLDQIGNVFGKTSQNYTATKTALYSEGYIHNCSLRSTILPSTSTGNSIDVNPLRTSSDSYAVLNGNKIQLDVVPGDTLSILQILSPGYQIAYVVYLTERGIQYRVSDKVSNDAGVQKPILPLLNTLVLGYYTIKQSLNGSLSETFTPVCLDTNGYVSPFRNKLGGVFIPDNVNPLTQIINFFSTFISSYSEFHIDVIAFQNNMQIFTEADSTQLKGYLSGLGLTATISLIDSQRGNVGGYEINVYEQKSSIYFSEPRQGWQQVLVLDQTYKPSGVDYQVNRIYHIWSWLSKSLNEKESLLVNTDGVKFKLDWIQQDHDNVSRYFVFGTSEQRAIEQSSIDFVIYMKDNELLTKLVPNGTDTTDSIGKESALYQSYLDGNVSDGDAVFYALGHEYDVVFNSVAGVNTITINNPSYHAYAGKILIQGTLLNNTVLSVETTTIVGNRVIINVAEPLLQEHINKVNIFDANQVTALDLSYVNGKFHASLESSDLTADSVYDGGAGADIEASDWKKTIDIEELISDTKISVDHKRYAAKLSIGDYLLAKPVYTSNNPNDKVRAWTRILDLHLNKDDDSKLVIVTDAAVETRASLGGGIQTDSFIPLHNWVTVLEFKVLEPSKVRDTSLPNGTDARQNEILNLVHETRLADALCTERVEWRYLVDSYGLGLTSNSKHQLASLAAKKGTLAFINFPSIKQFRNSQAPSFSTKGSFNSKLLLQGGDRKQNGGELFTLTTMNKSHAAYFTPYIKVGNLKVPPASYACGTYMNKYNVQNRYSWETLAGFRTGKIRGVSGLEEFFSGDELNDLNAFRVNAITSYQNTFFYIAEENTAETSLSSLGAIHSREALIDLESEIRDVLAAYQWQPFTVAKDNERAMVSAVNAICERYKTLNALTDYSNTFIATDEMIDSQYGIMSTEVELRRTFKTIILNVTVYNTNQIP